MLRARPLWVSMRVSAARALRNAWRGAWRVTHPPHAPPHPRRPPSTQTWNLFHCGVDEQVLNATAHAMHDSGLQAAGYDYVNSDVRERPIPLAPPRCAHARHPLAPPRQDCWMLAARDASGAQVANPAKFPRGFKAVADDIHALGLKAGLYTAKGPNTCAHFAASCDHEVQDAAQWATWGIDVSASPQRSPDLPRCAAPARSTPPPLLARRARSTSRTTRARSACARTARRGRTTRFTTACGSRLRLPAAPWCSPSKASRRTRSSRSGATAMPSALGMTSAPYGRP